jgi:hypothetical protein
MATHHSPKALLTVEAISAEIVKWVAESMRPFSIVDDRGFHTLMKTGRRKYHIPCADTVARDVKYVFKKTKGRIGKILHDYDGQLSFGTNGWTAPNHKSYVAITVHFMKDGAPYCLLLNIVELAKSHSGINLARAFADVLKEFGIEDKVNLGCDLNGYERTTNTNSTDSCNCLRQCKFK